MLLAGVHQGECRRHHGFLRQANLLQILEAGAEGRGVDVHTPLIVVRARYEHVVRRLDDGVALLEGHDRVLEVVVRVVEVDIDAPRETLAVRLVVPVAGVTGHPDAIVGDLDALRGC